MKNESSLSRRTKYTSVEQCITNHVHLSMNRFTIAYVLFYLMYDKSILILLSSVLEFSQVVANDLILRLHRERLSIYALSRRIYGKQELRFQICSLLIMIVMYVVVFVSVLLSPLFSMTTTFYPTIRPRTVTISMGLCIRQVNYFWNDTCVIPNCMMNVFTKLHYASLSHAAPTQNTLEPYFLYLQNSTQLLHLLPRVGSKNV